MAFYETQTANEMKDQLMLCMGQVIEKSFRSKYGEEWFSRLKGISSAEAQNPESTGRGAVINKKWKSINDLDFAALLKVFAYLDDALDIIANYYNVHSKKASIKKTALDLTKFRNSNAHKNIGKTKEEQHNIKDYSYYNFGLAMDDMLYFSSFFRQEKSESGESYYDILLRLHNGYLNNRTAAEQASARTAPPVYSNSGSGAVNVYTAVPNRKKSKAPQLIVIFAAALILAAAILTAAAVSGAFSGNDDSLQAENPQSGAAVTVQNEISSANTTQTTQPTTTAPAVSGSAEIYGLVLTVSRINGSTVTVDYENAQNSFSLGWVQTANVTAETTTGTYYSYLNDSI